MKHPLPIKPLGEINLGTPVLVNSGPPSCLGVHVTTAGRPAHFGPHLSDHTGGGRNGSLCAGTWQVEAVLLSSFTGFALVHVCVWYKAPRPCNRADGFPLKTNDSQSKKTTSICHLKQSLIVRQQQPRTEIDYKQIDTSPRAASRVIINKYPSLRHMHCCGGQNTSPHLGYTVNIPGRTLALLDPQ